MRSTKPEASTLSVT